ncbi:hypothetical protein [Allohahella marinimesophila]|uniref:Substrate-binding family protein n=1 Tax=Allohahella marinimesophila TaxID=1054972 RepID=A0ABP7NZL3_9GAMM
MRPNNKRLLDPFDKWQGGIALFGLHMIRELSAPIVDLRLRSYDQSLMYVVMALSLMLAGGSAALAETPQATIAFLNPATPDNIFWKKVTRLMRHGADQLGMKLVVSYQSQEDITSRFSYVNAATQVLEGSERPDYLVFLNMRDTGHRILKQAEKAGVKSMIILSDIHEDERRLFGEPREKFRHWIGHLVSDDRQAGYLLADGLLDVAQR